MLYSIRERKNFMLEIVVDTNTSKTVTVEASGSSKNNRRAMMDSITYIGYPKGYLKSHLKLA